MTGFRLAWGGVQTLMGIRPDLTCLGKIIGGGLPLAAVGGRRDVMEQLAPVGPVYQAGTLSGNPLAVAAGLATLELLDQARHLRAPRGARRAARGRPARRAAPAAGGAAASTASARCGRSSSASTAVRDADGARRCDTDAFARFFRGMLERGVYLPPSQFEAAFISLAHSDDDIDATRARGAARCIAGLRMSRAGATPRNRRTATAWSGASRYAALGFEFAGASSSPAWWSATTSTTVWAPRRCSRCCSPSAAWAGRCTACFGRSRSLVGSGRPWRLICTRIERLHVGLLGAHRLAWPYADATGCEPASLLLGGAVMGANFWLLRWIANVLRTVRERARRDLARRHGG